MPKLKSHKAVRKRFKITKKKKILQRCAGQDHFNARESGRITKRKRRKRSVSKANIKTIKKLIPYH